jgi:serine protease inhibitor
LPGQSVHLSACNNSKAMEWLFLNVSSTFNYRPTSLQTYVSSFSKTTNFIKQVNKPPNVVEVGNRVFLSSTFTPLRQYQDTLKNYYYADIARVDFPSPVYAAQSINSWVNMVTHGQIPSLVHSGMYYTVRSKSFKTDFLENRRHTLFF